ncbi:MAG: hypothetical protein DCE90_11810 [Pseudanabaena sp.]|nr:MAG: hypothetical protein DCE90_11810 [Pseudanabaena sp.]
MAIKTTFKNISKYLYLNHYLFLLVWSIPLIVFQGEYQSLLGHDEAYYATQARWIAEGKEWFSVQWWDTPIYDRAIGLQWLIAISYRFFGVSEITARLPNAIASILSILLTYSIGKKLINSSVSLLGACLLPMMFLWLHNSRVVSQDIVLTTFELIGIWALLKGSTIKLKHTEFGLNILAGTTLGLGFCIKSFMVFLFPIALLPYVLNKKIWRNLGIYIGIALGSILPIAWLTASWQRYGFLPFEQMFGKLLHLRGSDPNLYNPDNSWFYYFWNLPANTLPWSLLAIYGIFLIWMKRKLFDNISLLIGYPLVLFCLLTLFSTRMPYYTLQILPFWSLFAAYALESLSFKKWFRVMIGSLGILLLTISVLLSLSIVSTPSQVKPYLGLGFLAGTGWIIVNFLKTSSYWRFAVLIPIWIAIALAGLTGVLSDRSPEVRVALQQPTVANVLNSQIVDFVIQADLDPTDPLVWAKNADHPNWLLLSFYTSKLGKQVRSVSELSSGSYAWISPKAEKVDSLNPITSIKEWQLVHIK